MSEKLVKSTEDGMLTQAELGLKEGKVLLRVASQWWMVTAIDRLSDDHIAATLLPEFGMLHFRLRDLKAVRLTDEDGE